LGEVIKPKIEKSSSFSIHEILERLYSKRAMGKILRYWCFFTMNSRKGRGDFMFCWIWCKHKIQASNKLHNKLKNKFSLYIDIVCIGTISKLNAIIL